MRRIDRIRRILLDAERDFRCIPSASRDNQYGLCFYIESHELIYMLSWATQISYQREILGDISLQTRYATMPGKRGLGSAQSCYYNNGRSEYYYYRADWCKARLEALKCMN